MCTEFTNTQCEDCPGCGVNTGLENIGCGGFSPGECRICLKNCLQIVGQDTYTLDCENCLTSDINRADPPFCNNYEYILYTSYGVSDALCVEMEKFQKNAKYLTLDYTFNNPAATSFNPGIMFWIEHRRCMSDFTPVCIHTRVLEGTIQAGINIYAKCACRAGYYVVKGVQNDEDQSCRLKSPGNEYVPTYLCTRCPEGLYSTDYDIGCKPCPDGQKANPEQTGCVECKLGTYLLQNTDFDFRYCVDCPAGTYQDAPLQTFCHDCPLDQYSAAGATTCQYCLGPRNHTVDRVTCQPSCGGLCEYWNSINPHVSYEGPRTHVCPDMLTTSQCSACTFYLPTGDANALYECVYDSGFVYSAATFIPIGPECGYCSALFYDPVVRDDPVCSNKLYTYDVNPFSGQQLCAECGDLPWQFCDLHFVQTHDYSANYELFTRINCVPFSRGSAVPPSYGTCIDCVELENFMANNGYVCAADHYLSGCYCQGGATELIDTANVETLEYCDGQFECTRCFDVLNSDTVVWRKDKKVYCQLNCTAATGISLTGVCTMPCVEPPDCGPFQLNHDCRPPRQPSCEPCANAYGRDLTSRVMKVGQHNRSLNWIDRSSNSGVGSFENFMLARRDVNIGNRLCVRGSRVAQLLTGRGGVSYDQARGEFQFPTECEWDDVEGFRDGLELAEVENKFSSPGTLQWSTNALAYARIQESLVGVGDVYLELHLWRYERVLTIGPFDLTQSHEFSNRFVWSLTFYYRVESFGDTVADFRACLCSDCRTLRVPIEFEWRTAAFTDLACSSNAGHLAIYVSQPWDPNDPTNMTLVAVGIDEVQLLPNFVRQKPACSQSGGLEVCANAALTFYTDYYLRQIYPLELLPEPDMYGVRQLHIAFRHTGTAGRVNVTVHVNTGLDSQICSRDLAQQSHNGWRVCTFQALGLYHKPGTWQGSDMDVSFSGEPGFDPSSVVFTVLPNTCVYQCESNFYYFYNDDCQPCQPNCTLGFRFDGCYSDGSPICTDCSTFINTKPPFSHWLPLVCDYECDAGYWYDVYMSSTPICKPCETSACEVGFYRSACDVGDPGRCVQCTTKTSTSGLYAALEQYITAGQPYDQNNCLAECVDGSYRQGVNCIPCRTRTYTAWELRDLSPHWTLPCTRIRNSIPVECVGLVHGIYTGWPDFVGQDCPVRCDAGFYRSHFTQLINLNFYANVPPGADDIVVQYAHNKTNCLPCMMAALLNGTWGADCQYTCDEDHVKVSTPEAPYACLFCPGEPCPAGSYQSGCDQNATCLPCDPLGDPIKYYTGAGDFERPGSCPLACVDGFYDPGFGRPCAPCQPRRCRDQCDPGYFKVANCTSTEDIRCESCNVSSPAHAYIDDQCRVQCYDDFVPFNASRCLYCDPGRLCPVGFYADTCSAANAFTGCSPCRNGIAANGSVVFLTPGAPYEPYTCAWRCADGFLLLNNGSGHLECQPPPVAPPRPTPAPPEPVFTSCPPGLYVTQQLQCAACTNYIPPLHAAWVQGCVWACLDGRIAVIDPVQQVLTCMLYADFIAISQNSRRVLIQNPFNDTYRDHAMADGSRTLLLGVASIAAVILVIGSGIACKLA